MASLEVKLPPFKCFICLPFPLADAFTQPLFNFTQTFLLLRGAVFCKKLKCVSECTYCAIYLALSWSTPITCVITTMFREITLEICTDYQNSNGQT